MQRITHLWHKETKKDGVARDKIADEVFDVLEEWCMLMQLNAAQMLEMVQWVNEENKLTFWSEWEIYKVPVHLSNGMIKVFLVAKKRFDNNVYNEFAMHKRAYDIIKKNPHVSVKVPQLFGKFEWMDGSTLIIMEFMKGKTLYAKIVEELIQSYLAPHVVSHDFYSEDEDEDDVHDWWSHQNYVHQSFYKKIENDKDADEALLQYFNVKRTREFIEDLIYNPTRYSTAAWCKQAMKSFGLTSWERLHWLQLFSQQQWKKIQRQLQEFFDCLHAEGLYHRDIGANIRNIMFDAAGNPSVIDFWKSKIITNAMVTEKKIYAGEQKWDLPYMRDENICDIIAAYCK